MPRFSSHSAMTARPSASVVPRGKCMVCAFASDLTALPAFSLRLALSRAFSSSRTFFCPSVRNTCRAMVLLDHLLMSGITSAMEGDMRTKSRSASAGIFPSTTWPAQAPPVLVHRSRKTRSKYSFGSKAITLKFFAPQARGSVPLKTTRLAPFFSVRSRKPSCVFQSPQLPLLSFTVFGYVTPAMCGSATTRATPASRSGTSSSDKFR